MTAASPHLSVDIAANDHKRGSIRKGSIFNLFNIASNERLNETTDVDIQLFDGTRMCALIDYRITGEILLNHIALELGDAAKAKYLGLIIEPPGKLPEWMDLYNSVAKEKSAKGFNVVLVRVKFYPADPVLEMQPECFAKLLYYQLRHDLAVGRLLGKERDRCLMVAYSIKYEGGLEGVCKSELQDCDVVRSKISPHALDNSMQNQIKEYLEENYEISAEEARNSFLRVSTRMDTYGIEPFDAKDQRGNGIAVGFNFRGLSVFKSSQQVNFFRWESMSNFECERKNVVITIKTRDIKKKIGFKSDSRANAMQLFRRLREASKFFSSAENWGTKLESERPTKIGSTSLTKSTESMNSDSSTPSSNQTCKITRLRSITHPQRYFTLSLPRVHFNPSALTVPPAENAATPTNQPTHPLPFPPKSSTTFLHLPEPDEGPKTPTPNQNSDSATSGTELIDSRYGDAPHNTNQFSAGFNEDYNGIQKKDSSTLEGREEKEYQEIKKMVNLGAEDPESYSGYEAEEIKDPVVTIKIDLMKDESDSSKDEEEGKEAPLKLKCLSDSSSQESLANYHSPFGDVVKTQMFSECGRNKFGVLDLQMSVSTTSITVPSVGNAAPPAVEPTTHFFPRRRSRQV